MKKQFQFPLKQGIGAPAVPSVVKGDDVVRGQLIAYPEEGKLGTAIYASVSGTVTEVTDTAITVEAAEKQEKTYVPLQGDDPLDLQSPLQRAGR